MKTSFVLPAKPLGLNGIFPPESLVLLRQCDFPDEYGEGEELLVRTSRELFLADPENTHLSYLRHMTVFTHDYDEWFMNASDQVIIAYLVAVMKLEEGLDWTGYRITKFGDGIVTSWRYELFRRSQNSDTKLYSGQTAPNTYCGSMQ